MTDRTCFIDWLSFSFPLSAMKELETFKGDSSHYWRKYGKFPSSKGFSSKRDRFFTDVLDPKTRCWCPSESDYEGYVFDSKSLSEVENEISRYNDLCQRAYVERLKLFLATVFGLVMSSPRDRGGYNYAHSANLYSDIEGYDSYGLVFWGGNNDTAFIQINGAGCSHVFTGTTCKSVYQWLNHIGVSKLNRLDLAVDDFDGVFTPSAAYKDYLNDAFSNGVGRKKSYEFNVKYDGKGIKKVDIFRVGSRQSSVYWRIYDKALEQRVDRVWFRSEVELKEVLLESLLDISGSFTSLCPYSRQISCCPAVPFKIVGSVVKKALNSLEAKVKCLNKQWSSISAKILKAVDGNLKAFISLIIQDRHLEDENLVFPMNDFYKSVFDGVYNCSFETC